jgi:hypothetical protein
MNIRRSRRSGKLWRPEGIEDRSEVVVPETFDQVMQSALHAHHFRAFLKSRTAVAPLLLLEAIDCYRAMDDEAWRVRAAEAILNTFLKVCITSQSAAAYSLQDVRVWLRLVCSRCDCCCLVIGMQINGELRCRVF